MKLTEMNLQLAQELMKWWVDTADARVDEAKNPDVLYQAMFEDGGNSQFYTVPGVLFVLTSINPNTSAVLYELGVLDEEYDIKETKNELINIVREYGLKRLTFACPSCVTAYGSKLKPLGFKYEGRMKFAATYNGKLADIDLYGFYSVKPSKRRRRGRRDGRKEESTVTATNGTGNSSVEPDSIYEEEKRSPDLAGEVRLGRVDTFGSKPEGNSARTS